jgi:hypothetical protein
MPISQRQDQGGAHRRSFRPPHQARGIDQQARQGPRRRKSDYTALWTHRFFPAAKKKLSFFLCKCLCVVDCLLVMCRALHAVPSQGSVPPLPGAAANTGRHRLLASGQKGTVSFVFIQCLPCMLYSKLFRCCCMFLQIQNKYGGSTKAMVSYCCQL